LAVIDKFTAIIRTNDQAFNINKAFRGYAKYILQSGSEFEMTRLIRNMNCKLAIHNRTIVELSD
jgi:hypothetical protein